MPLPENWDGVFYPEETCGDQIFDLSPTGFIEFVSAHDVNPRFVTAGACFDLLWNDYKEESQALAVAAQKRWKGDPLFSFVPIIVATAKAIFAQGAEKDEVALGAYNLIARLGGDLVKVQEA
jgi:hypothetical protein